MPALSISKVSKSYGRLRVLADFSLDIKFGDCVLLLGANGGGKSTLLRICGGVSRADSGRVSVKIDEKLRDTNDIPRPERALLFGHLGHESYLYRNLSIRENLQLTADVMGLTQKVQAQIEEWDLVKFADTRVENLSKGLQLRAGLCRIFYHRPKFLFLDEPSAALDQVATDLLISKIQKLKSAHQDQCCVVIATHDLHRLEGLANRVVLLREGKIVSDSSLLTAQNNHDQKAITISLYREVNR